MLLGFRKQNIEFKSVETKNKELKIIEGIRNLIENFKIEYQKYRF